MDSIKVEMFGNFSLTYKNKSINGNDMRSRKMLSLLHYLVYHHGKNIPESEIIDALWNAGESGDPSNALKTLLFRLRVLVSSIGIPNIKEIITHRQYYFSWTSKGPVELDTEQFEQLCKKQCSDPDERLSCLLDALSLYDGTFLSAFATDLWVAPIASFYHNMFLSAMREAVSLLQASGQYTEIVRLTTKAVSIDPYCEELYICLIRALVASGSYAAAKQQYDNALNMFYDQFGTTPSEEFLDLYSLVVKTENPIENDLSKIKNALILNNEENGACQCEYAFFRQYYSVLRYFISRQGTSAHLALITLSAQDGSVPPVKRLSSAMDSLADCIVLSLRHTDVFTRYSVSQYLLLLPLASYENSCMAVGRVLRAFSKKHPRSTLKISFTVQAADTCDFIPFQH